MKRRQKDTREAGRVTYRETIIKAKKKRKKRTKGIGNQLKVKRKEDKPALKFESQKLSFNFDERFEFAGERGSLIHNSLVF